jgi:hypothetical protein
MTCTLHRGSGPLSCEDKQGRPSTSSDAAVVLPDLGVCCRCLAAAAAWVAGRTAEVVVRIFIDWHETLETQLSYLVVNP